MSEVRKPAFDEGMISAEILQRLREQPDSLGFNRAPEMLSIRAAAVEAMSLHDWSAIKNKLGAYQDAAVEIIERLDGHTQAVEHKKAQTGLLIDTALMWQEANKLDSYAAELCNAINFAHNLKLVELEELLAAAVADVEEIKQQSEAAPYMGPPPEEMVAKAKAELPPQLHEELDYLITLPPDEVMEEIASLMLGSDVPEDPQAFFVRMGWINNASTR